MNISRRSGTFALATEVAAVILVRDPDSLGPEQFSKGGDMQVEAARALIADHLAVGLDTVRDDAVFADLGADSLDMIELAMRFEDELGIFIGDEEAESCTTVGDALQLIHGKTSRVEAA